MRPNPGSVGATRGAHERYPFVPQSAFCAMQYLYAAMRHPTVISLVFQLISLLTC